MGGVNKRQHLIRTGQELIWARGYELCSIKDITSAAGLPKGSFYHYFESKEKFAIEAMNDFIEEHEEQLPDSKYTLKTLEKMLDIRIASILKIQFARECYMSVMCHAFNKQEDGFRKEVLAAIEKSNQSMAALLTELQNRGYIRTDLSVVELLEYIDFGWRGARLKARMSKSDAPLKIFKKYLFSLIKTS